MKRWTLETKSRTIHENAKGVAALLSKRRAALANRHVFMAHTPLNVRVSVSSLKRNSLPIEFRTREETSWTEYSMAGKSIWLGILIDHQAYIEAQTPKGR